MKYYFTGYGQDIFNLSFLNKIGINPTNLGDTCQQEETVAHFIIYCKQYNIHRQAMIDQLSQLGITNFNLTKLVSGKICQPVADYIYQTNRI